MTDNMHGETQNDPKKKLSKSQKKRQKKNKKIKKAKKHVCGGVKEECVVCITDIQFAFKNYKMIQTLKTRGSAITALDFEQMKICDEEVKTLIENEYDDLIEPVCAFITFEKDDGVNEALNYMKPNWLKANLSKHVKGD